MAKMIKIEDQVSKLTRTIAGGSFGSNTIKVYRREFEEGRFTNDIFVNDKIYSPAVGDSILEIILQRAQEHVLKGGL